MSFDVLKGEIKFCNLLEQNRTLTNYKFFEDSVRQRTNPEHEEIDQINSNRVYVYALYLCEAKIVGTALKMCINAYLESKVTNKCNIYRKPTR